MGVIKKVSLKAYILTESLAGLAIFASIVTLLLTAVQSHSHQVIEAQKQQEALLLAQMAVQTGRDQLTLNGEKVQIERDTGSLRLRLDGEELVYVYQIKGT